jgi:hypothetical protein
MKKSIIIICSLLLTLSVSGQTVFDSYFEKAKAFAEAFPREKVHLHFDNTSYYQGDTIWFKAYAVTVGNNQYSRISKPLYVELVDQLGNIMERQIVKLSDGTGEGQISLSNAFFTGYYEVRAYTKWMLAFNSDTYFTRTFPIYKKPLSTTDKTRQIAEYRMDDSMEQRPKDKLGVLNVNFYPEGGKLVQGVTGVVGVETLSRDSGWVNIQGILVASDGTKLRPINTIHDGMGSFVYTPTDKPATVEFMYAGKKRKFKLPAAEPSGYNIILNNKESEFDITISRNASTTCEPLALFISSGGMPYNYVPIDLSASASKRIKVLTDGLPAGVAQLSLINSQGLTLLDRFAFVYPKDTPNMQAVTDKAVYTPFSKIGCDVSVTAADGKPLAGVPVSVSLCDASVSDFVANGTTIATDLLLTSELKGYINRPEFYFEQHSASRRKMLDNLILIRGWRKYDLQQSFGVKEFKPKYLPEDKLMLYGKVKSYFQGNAGLNVTILANNDTSQVAGVTVTDSLGRFSVPLDDFEGRMDALFQTRKEGKRINRASTISMERLFEPALRKYDFCELNPLWDSAADSASVSKLIAEIDPYSADDEEAIVLDELVVKAKNKKKRTLYQTERFERSILGYYNIRQIVDNMRDKGKIINGDIGNLMHEINPNINFKGTHYKVDSIVYCVQGKNMDRMFIDNYIDDIETAMLYYDRSGTKAFSIDDDFKAKESTVKDYWTDVTTDTANVAALKELYVRLDFTMDKRFNPNKSYLSSRGIRKTYIQGYNRPAAFYSPQYPEGAYDTFDDNRRTLYWNPSLVTDNNGKIHIDCYNSRNPTYLTISAETIVDGRPTALNVNSIEASNGNATLVPSVR